MRNPMPFTTLLQTLKAQARIANIVETLDEIQTETAKYEELEMVSAADDAALAALSLAIATALNDFRAAASLSTPEE